MRFGIMLATARGKRVLKKVSSWFPSSFRDRSGRQGLYDIRCWPGRLKWTGRRYDESGD